MKSEQINELAAALSKAQGEMSAATKDSNNPFFKSKYADLNSVWEACRGPLSRNGLSVSQIPFQDETESCLYTILMHSSGQWIQSKMMMRIKPDTKTNELQVMGSCISYLRRYALMAIVGIAPGDEDDGNSVTSFQANPTAKPAQQKIIAPERATELRDIVKKCSPGFIAFVADYLKKGQIADLNALPEVLFDNLYKQAIDDCARTQLAKKQQEQEVTNGVN